jgi:hypothetical protein
VAATATNLASSSLQRACLPAQQPLYEDTPGVFAIQTFATERKAVFTFDASVTSTDKIRAIMEAPIEFTDGTTGRVFKCRSAEQAGWPEPFLPARSGCPLIPAPRPNRVRKPPAG